MKPVFASLFIYAFALWLLCGATIGISRTLTSMDATLIIHAVLVPFFAVIISFLYYKRADKLTEASNPVMVATVLTMFALLMDALIVAPFIEKSYDMFRSILGTWLPLALIFIFSYATGIIITRLKRAAKNTKKHKSK